MYYITEDILQRLVQHMNNAPTDTEQDILAKKVGDEVNTCDGEEQDRIISDLTDISSSSSGVDIRTLHQWGGAANLAMDLILFKRSLASALLKVAATFIWKTQPPAKGGRILVTIEQLPAGSTLAPLPSLCEAHS